MLTEWNISWNLWKVSVSNAVTGKLKIIRNNWNDSKYVRVQFHEGD